MAAKAWHGEDPNNISLGLTSPSSLTDGIDSLKIIFICFCNLCCVLCQMQARLAERRDARRRAAEEERARREAEGIRESEEARQQVYERRPSTGDSLPVTIHSLTSLIYLSHIRKTLSL